MAEMGKQIPMERAQNQFIIDKFLPKGKTILAELTIDENTKLHLTDNCLFVVDEWGLEDIFIRRQIVHISFHFFHSHYKL